MPPSGPAPPSEGDTRGHEVRSGWVGGRLRGGGDPVGGRPLEWPTRGREMEATRAAGVVRMIYFWQLWVLPDGV